MILSFTDDVKHELTRFKTNTENKLIHRAELAGLIRMNGIIQIINKELGIKVKFFHGDLARKIYSLLKDEYNFTAKIIVKECNHFSRQHLFQLVLTPQPGIKKFLFRLGFLDNETNISFNTKDEFINNKDCQKAYLRGAFLGGGSVNSPQSEYHLEFRCEHQEQAGDLLKLLAEFDLKGHLTEHNGKYVIYFKGYKEITTLLNIIGAHQALLKMEDVQVLKEVKNNVNRRVNCETANLDKTVKASMVQLENIELIEKNKGLNKLSESLKEISILRKDHPYASLKELGKLLDPPLSKSGVNHRLRRIKEIAQDIRGED